MELAIHDLLAGQDHADRGCRIVEFGADDGLARTWFRLEKAASLPTQSHAFAWALSRSLLADARLEVLIATGERGSGALLPLCRERSYFAPWRAMGAREVFEPMDVLGSDPGSLDLLAGAIARQPRALQLDRIPVASPLVPALRKAMRGRGWLSVRPALPCPKITLGQGWTDPESCFNARRRSDFRRAARRASERGSVSYEVLSPEPDHFDACFDEAIGVELNSWKREAGTAIAVHRGKEKFFREFFRSAAERGELRMAFLRIDGRAVAMQMALESLGSYWLFKIGYDEEFGKCSPGTLLMLHTLAWAAGRRLRSFELLGNAEPWIAELWTQENVACVQLRSDPFGIRGAAAFAKDALAWALRRLTRPAA